LKWGVKLCSNVVEYVYILLFNRYEKFYPKFSHTAEVLTEVAGGYLVT